MITPVAFPYEISGGTFVMYFVNSSVKGSNLKKKLLDVSTIHTLSLESIDNPLAVLRSLGNSNAST